MQSRSNATILMKRVKELTTFFFPCSMRQGIVWALFRCHGQQLFSFLVFVEGIGYLQRGQMQYYILRV